MTPYPTLAYPPHPPSLLFPPPLSLVQLTMFQNGYTALILAAERGKLSCLELLVEKGADLNAKNNVRDECGAHV